MSVFTIVFLLLALRSAIGRAARPWPLTPWESAITVDAWRLNHHLPVYENPQTGHATHMYGPLVTMLAAVGERIGGVDVRVPRAMSLIASLLTAVAAGWLLGVDRRWPARVLIAAVTYLQFYRILEWSTDARPDAESILVSLLALAALFRGQGRSSRMHWTVLGSLGLVVAFAFKQPAMVLCVVPLLVGLGGKVMRSRAAPPQAAWGRSMLPIVAAAMTWLVLRTAFPWVYFYLFTVPASYPVVLSSLRHAPAESVELNHLFLLAVGGSLFVRFVLARPIRLDAIDAWLIATIGVTLLFGMVARSKVGGGHNSLLPALIAMGALAVRLLDRLWSAATPLPIGWLVAALAPLLGWMDLRVVLRVPLPGGSPMLVQHGDASYPAVVRAAAGLPGRLASLDDPTIALLAKGVAGRCGDCELDANRRQLPQFAIDDLKGVDWLIQTKASRQPTIGDEQLARLGFRPIADRLPATAVYTLWRRETP